MKTLLTFLYATVFCVVNPLAVAAEVRIADVMTITEDTQFVTVLPGRFAWMPIPFLSPNDEARIGITLTDRTYNDIGIFVCSESDLANFGAGRGHRCLSLGKTVGHNTITAKPIPGGINYLVLDNTFANFFDKDVYVVMTIAAQLPTEVKQGLQASLGQLMTGLSASFETSTFDLTVQSCGQENAFSETTTGNITVCFEVIWNAVQNNELGVFVGVLAHELGHSLLNLWGEPSYANEAVADEFATVFLIMDKQESAAWQWVNWWQRRQDTQGEAAVIERTGDTHPLTVQRVNAIKSILQDPSRYLDRWKPVIYRHMTTIALRAKLAEGLPIAEQTTINDILRAR